MSIANFTACPSTIALQRIATARWTPYVANTWRNWSREALMAEDACASRRAVDCDGCRALQKIVVLPWTNTLGERIAQTAHDVLGHHAAPKLIKRETVCAPF